MEKQKKKRLKRYIAWGSLAVFAAILAVMPMLASSRQTAEGPEASILSAEAARADVDTVLLGGGTLSGEAAVEITIPASVKLTEYLVENGDLVSAGDPIARVDRVTVMTAVTQVQETMEYLAGEIEEVRGDVVSEAVTAGGGGTVKLVCAREGESVQEVMLRDGALAVLSLDGRMAVELETEAALSAGDGVTVTLSDGTAVKGTVKSNLEGVLTVTIADDGYAIGETVQVSTEDGTNLGSGALYIHNQWNATAYAGTVAEIKVSEGDEVDPGDTLMELENTGVTSEFETLTAQRREYEALMLELFQMYQSQLLTAPVDGMVSGVDEDSAYLLSDAGEGWSLNLLLNAPNGDDETLYTSFIGQVAQVGIDGLVMKMNPQKLEITDYTDLSAIPTAPELMTEDAVYTDDAPIYAYVDEAWVQVEPAVVQAGDLLLFALDGEGNFVWVIRIAAQTEPEVTEQTEPAAPSEPTEPTVPEEPTEPSEPVTPTVPDAGTQPEASYPQTGGSTQGGLSGGFSGGFAGGYSGGTVETEPEFEAYSLDTVTVASVTPQGEMTLEITVDELDIGSLSLGQTAGLTVNALTGRHFTATVTEIANSGTSDGGNSKFTVELTLERAADMLPGMNATASITLDTAADVLTVPVAALYDEGGKTVVYTSFDEEAGTLGNPVEVTVGVSDGENAQILAGLEEGAVCWYEYYDTLYISDAPETGGFPFMR